MDSESDGEGLPGMEDEDERAMDQIRKITSKMRGKHGDRDTQDPMQPRRYYCGFGVPRKKSAGEIREELERIIDSPTVVAVVGRKEVRRKFDTPMNVGIEKGVRSMSAPIDVERKEALKPRTFQFIEDMRERERKKRIRDNTEGLKKVLDKERQQTHRKLTAPPRKPVVKKRLEADKRDVLITSFFNKKT